MLGQKKMLTLTNKSTTIQILLQSFGQHLMLTAPNSGVATTTTETSKQKLQ